MDLYLPVAIGVGHIGGGGNASVWQQQSVRTGDGAVAQALFVFELKITRLWIVDFVAVRIRSRALAIQDKNHKFEFIFEMVDSLPSGS